MQAQPTGGLEAEPDGSTEDRVPRDPPDAPSGPASSPEDVELPKARSSGPLPPITTAPPPPDQAPPPSQEERTEEERRELARQIAGMYVAGCRKLTEWTKANGGEPIFPDEVYEHLMRPASERLLLRYLPRGATREDLDMAQAVTPGAITLVGWLKSRAAKAAAEKSTPIDKPAPETRNGKPVVETTVADEPAPRPAPAASPPPPPNRFIANLTGAQQGA